MALAGWYFMTVFSAVGFAYLGARWGLLWWGRRQSRKHVFHCYPFITPRSNSRKVHI